jgi:hypothetical protein
MAKKVQGKGRPSIDDRDILMFHITSRVNAGASVAAAARGGLTVLGYEHKTGEATRTARYMNAATLERRYRESREGIVAMHERLSLLAADTRFIGVLPPQLTTPFVPSRELRRGRPRKSRTR